MERGKLRQSCTKGEDRETPPQRMDMGENGSWERVRRSQEKFFPKPQSVTPGKLSSWTCTGE